MDLAQGRHGAVGLPVAADPTAFPPRRPENGIVRLGILGCGYVTKVSHLPAAALLNEIKVTALVDVRLEVAQELAAAHQVPLATSDYTQIVDQVDAVIIAVPHQDHTPLAVEFMRRGVHVLVEKPLAITTAECREMIAVSEATGAKLAVGHMRRFYDSNRLVKRMIESRFLGEVLRFEAEEAVLFDNFKASPFTVLPPAGGVLLDTGPHLLDMLHWWLGDFEELQCWDDAGTGVEANAHLEVRTAGGVPGTVGLSRTRKFENRIRLHCEQGTIEALTLNPTQVFVDSPLFSGPVVAARKVPENEVRRIAPYFAVQLADFAHAILEDRQPFVTGAEGMRSIATIERCKRERQPLPPQPWTELHPAILERVP